MPPALEALTGSLDKRSPRDDVKAQAELALSVKADRRFKELLGARAVRQLSRS